jgi:putative PEP-CTERM system histidine kinase
VTASFGLHAGAAGVCLVWALLILLAGRSRTALLPAAASLAAAIWALAVALAPALALVGPAGALETLRSLVWVALLLSLARRIGAERARPLVRNFAIAAALLGTVALADLLPAVSPQGLLPSLGAPTLLARFAIAILLLVIAENILRNADEAQRWHVSLPCIALGGLAGFDVLLYADAALSGQFSVTLVDARAVLTALAMPLLAIAAVRDRRLRRDPPVSREVVFRGATLVVAGTFLLGVGAAGEALRALDADWGRTAQASLLAGAALVLAVALSSGSVRSRLRRLVVDHFFTARYDYRREWLRCVAALSAPDDEAPAETRAIRAIADPVDSPAGVLLLRDGAEGGGHGWAGSWNLPARPFALGSSHPLGALLGRGEMVAAFGNGAAPPADLVAAYGTLWLAVPLQHPREGLFGIVLLAPPRAPFPLDAEVFELLRTLGREVAMFLAERRAAERLVDSRRLQDYAKRFAFVAHDVKTVSSQLTMLLANAEENLSDPEFQRDMLTTVRASATRINTLIARLRQDEGDGMTDRAAAPEAGTLDPLARLAAIAAGRAHPVELRQEGGAPGLVAATGANFDAMVTHLLDNAAEASPPGAPVVIRLAAEAGRAVIEIADRGPGMSPEFIRDRLFRPFDTSKPGGSGIGAWQARDLARRAGGDLAVVSRVGEGTTMRLLLPLVGATAGAAE